MICCSIIRGSGRPRLGLFINFIFYYCAALPLGIILAFYVFKSGVEGKVPTWQRHSMRVTLWGEARRKRNSNAKLDKRYSVLLSIAFTSKRDILDARGASLARDYARTLSCIFWYSKPYTPLALTTTSLVRRKAEEKFIQSLPYLETLLIRPTRWPDYIFMTVVWTGFHFIHAARLF